MMRLVLTDGERAAVRSAQASERRVRAWRRYQAILLLAQHPPEVVAQTLGCGRSTVYRWAAAWEQAGLVGVQEPPRPGRARLLGPPATAILTALVASDPQAHGQQATGWTVPMLQHQLRLRGYPVSARTVRRTLHRLGWRWKRPKYVLGRPDPAAAEKKGR